MTGGFQRLRQQAIESVNEYLNEFEADAIGDSPIEKLLFAALKTMVLIDNSEYRHIEVPSERYPLAASLAREDGLSLIVVPQAQLEGWRVDFLIYAWDFGRATGKAQWRRLIVECDGHDFHERTKEQAARDRSRDRAAQISGATVMRFTGSEIHKDPLGCAMQISEWGTMGW